MRLENSNGAHAGQVFWLLARDVAHSLSGLQMLVTIATPSKTNSPCILPPFAHVGNSLQSILKLAIPTFLRRNAGRTFFKLRVERVVQSSLVLE